MIIFSHNLIFGSIKLIVSTIFKLVYKIIAFLNLQLALLIALIGVVLFFTGVFEGNGAFLSVYCVVLICSAIFGVILSLLKLLGIDKRKKTRGKVKITNSSEIANVQEKAFEVASQPQLNVNESVNSRYNTEEQPKYYAVKQNQNYIMAEYSDRYELFLKTPQGLKKVRVDYKNGQS